LKEDKEKEGTSQVYQYPNGNPEYIMMINVRIANDF
jgi:hypothetical protein